jgi:hypothetical protein
MPEINYQRRNPIRELDFSGEAINLRRMPSLMISSSHMTDRHHFQNALDRVWQLNFEGNPIITRPSINAKGGRRLTEGFAKMFEEILEDLPVKTAILLNLGDNNLSPCSERNLKKAQNKVLKILRKILEIHSRSDHLLCVLGILPRPRHTLLQAACNEDTDEKIRSLVEEFKQKPSGNRVKYFQPLPWFLNENNRLMGMLFDPDRVHLSYRGALQLAGNSIDCLITLAEDYQNHLRGSVP